MKQGLTLSKMAEEIQFQNDRKKDYIVGTRSVYMNGNSGLCLETENAPISFDLTQQAHQQIAARLKIPSSYYQKCLTESPRLLAENVNTWFEKNPENRMIRTLSSSARAFLSDQYLIVDNLDIIEAVFPVLESLGLGKNIVSCNLGTDKMYLKVINDKLQAEIKEGDVVQSGFVITNSETGRGATAIQPLIYRLVCSNGLIMPESGIRRIHLGRKIESNDFAATLFTPQTRLHERELYLRQIVDVVRSMADPKIFNKIVDTLRDSTKHSISAQPQKAVEVLAQRVKLSEDEQAGVLNHLLLAGDLSRYGMVNAVTRLSQDLACYDRASEMEELGSKVLHMSISDWGSIATAGI
jgi:Domain of unknown function (DUF932)